MRKKEYKIIELLDLLVSIPRPLVFTNGVFDILHSGHVTYLNNAKSIGGTLLVAVNSDESVNGLKKEGKRPINGVEERVKVLAGLEAVDLITIFTEQTPLTILNLVKPDIYVKGGDYKESELLEAKLVRSWGGDCKIIGYIDGVSTTQTIKKIRNM